MIDTSHTIMIIMIGFSATAEKTLGLLTYTLHRGNGKIRIQTNTSSCSRRFAKAPTSHIDTYTFLLRCSEHSQLSSRSWTVMVPRPGGAWCESAQEQVMPSRQGPGRGELVLPPDLAHRVP